MVYYNVSSFSTRCKRGNSRALPPQRRFAGQALWPEIGFA